MAEVNQDFDIYQNASEVVNIAVTDAAGTPIDLTTMDSICWILSRGANEIIRYTLADPELVIVNIDAVNDGIRITLPPAVTGALNIGNWYRHQGWVTLAGRPRPLQVGSVTVLQGDGC